MAILSFYAEGGNGGGGDVKDYELIATITPDGTSPMVELVSDASLYSHLIVERTTPTITNAFAYLSLGKRGQGDSSNLWLGSLNNAYRAMFYIELSPVITSVLAYRYNFGNDTMRLDAFLQGGTAFGADLARPLYIDFYTLEAAPTTDTYRIFGKKR